MSYRKSIQVRKQLLKKLVTTPRDSDCSIEYRSENIREIARQIRLFVQADAESKLKRRWNSMGQLDY
jgi:hypothetical protein